MPESNQPVYSALGRDLQRLWSDLADMLRARRQLAELEIRSDIAASKRLVIVAAVGATLALTGLPLLAMLAADALAEWLEMDRHRSLLLVGSMLVVCGLATIWRAWRGFRSGFVGLEESLAELKEDSAWLREWTGQDDNRDA